jgi:HK97 gp10 family phage protein
MKLYLTMTGVPELRRAFANVTPEIERGLAGAVRETAIVVVAGAKSRVPVRSGELRDTIRADFTGNGLVAFIKAGYGTLRRRSRRGSSSARYAKHSRRRRAAQDAPGIYAMVVEFGSTKQPAHPFMFPALESARPGCSRRARRRRSSPRSREP